MGRATRAMREGQSLPGCSPCCSVRPTALTIWPLLASMQTPSLTWFSPEVLYFPFSHLTHPAFSPLPSLHVPGPQYGLPQFVL